MTRRIIGVLLAIILAIAGTGLVFLWINTAEERVAASQEAVQVVLANERIPAGTSGARLREQELVREVVMPASSVPEGALSSIIEDLADLEDQVVTSDLHPDQLLMRRAFGPPAQLTGGLAVPDTKVAVSVRIDVHQQVAGYVRPGSHIAIFNTYGSDDDDEIDEGADNTRTRLLLPRVEVLAVGVFGDGGVTTTTADEDEEGRSGLVLTVAVSQDEAERLIHASRTGQLYLALLTDTSEIEPGPGVDSRNLFP
jgi:pilus assembly protein CpaB